jgi:hypothetical protein
MTASQEHITGNSTIDGTCKATSFIGNGSQLTNVNAVTSVSSGEESYYLTGKMKLRAGANVSIARNGNTIEVTNGYGGGTWADGSNHNFTGNNTFTKTTTFEGDIFTVPETDYGSSTTLNGISSATKYIYYKRIGKLCFITFKIYGTVGVSNEVNFTVPYNAKHEVSFPLNYCVNNNAPESSNGWGVINNNTFDAGPNVVNCYRVGANTNTWSGTAFRATYGQFFYEVE